MKKWKVKATIEVPVYGVLVVEARSKEEAEKKALKTAKGCPKNEWGSELWQNGNWTKGVQWDSAEKLEIYEVEEA